jgi:hypothetical protein
LKARPTLVRRIIATGLVAGACLALVYAFAFLSFFLDARGAFIAIGTALRSWRCCCFRFGPPFLSSCECVVAEH